MSVEVRIPTMLRSHVAGAATVQADGSTVREIIDQLVAEHPSLGGQIVTGDGTLHKFVNVYLNDDDIRYLPEKESTPTSDSDELTIIPSIAGGY